MRFPVNLFGEGVLKQNSVPNPSFEYDTVGQAPAAWSTSSPAFWLTSGATLSVVNAVGTVDVGGQACQVTTTASSGEGLAVQLVAPTGGWKAGTTYTFSVYLKGNVGGEQVQLALGAASADSATAPVTLASNIQRFNVIWTPSSNETTVYAVVRSNVASAMTFFVDGAQVSAGSAPVVYEDGDQPQWQWLGTPGNSMSQNYFSRDGMAQLVERVNTLINLPGQTVLWQDQGSSQPTYFDLASGQLDLFYDFRRAGNYLISGMLRLFCQPLGHTATTRLVASAAGTGPLVTLPIASPILGDAPALIQAQISGGSFASAAWDTAALSVLPYGYVPEYQASSLVPGASTTLVGGSGAVASLFYRQILSSGATTVPMVASSLFTTLNLYAASPYFGINRLLAVARATFGMTGNPIPTVSGAWLQAQYLLGGTQALVGPTVSFVASTIGSAFNPAGWAIADLGTVNVPSSLPAATLSVQVWAAYQLQLTGPGGQATFTLDITDLILLPDGQTAFVGAAGAVRPGWSLHFDAINSESYVNNGGGVLQYRETSVQRGAIPKVPVNASAQLAAVFMPQATSLSSAPANDLISASVTVRERVRFSF
jgi:hypothetical protein